MGQNTEEPVNELMEIEGALFKEMQETYKKEIERRLQAKADSIPIADSEGHPLKKKRRVTLSLTCIFGKCRIVVWKGFCESSQKWIIPAREAWRLKKKQRMTPLLQRKLCCTAVETGSFEKAAGLAGEWGVSISDDAVRSCVIELGNQAVKTPQKSACSNQAGENDSLVIMMDGWFARHRGEDWGVKRRTPEDARVRWCEIKSAVIFRIQDIFKDQNKRGLLIKKHAVATPADTDPVTFGQAVEREAVRMGLCKAAHVYVIMDGGVYLWNIFEDRFAVCSAGLLDFYHASQHLHALAAELFKDDMPAAKKWCTKLLHSLKHKSSKKFFKTLAELVSNPPEETSAVTEAISSANTYFERHRNHMNYAALSKKGVPIGSGAMESQCGQFQDRFKRRGQFWTKKAFEAFIEVAVRHQNGEIESLWAA